MIILMKIQMDNNKHTPAIALNDTRNTIDVLALWVLVTVLRVHPRVEYTLSGDVGYNVIRRKACPWTIVVPCLEGIMLRVH
jgi:hypothetical protein